MQLPASMIDYVLVHEFAHMREPAHGQAFWRLVEGAMPEYEPSRRWLAESGQQDAGI